jgi:hypothetical protein
VTLLAESAKSAADTTKQIVTMATGVLAITITFADKFGLAAARPALFFAWAAFVFAIATGVLTLMSVTGEIGHAEKAMAEAKDPTTVTRYVDPSIGAVQFFGILTVLAFGLGISAVSVAGFQLVLAPAQKAPPVCCCPPATNNLPGNRPAPARG